MLPLIYICPMFFTTPCRHFQYASFLVYQRKILGVHSVVFLLEAFLVIVFLGELSIKDFLKNTISEFPTL